VLVGVTVSVDLPYLEHNEVCIVRLVRLVLLNGFEMNELVSLAQWNPHRILGSLPSLNYEPSWVKCGRVV
jgi:hypothetical protein